MFQSTFPQGERRFFSLFSIISPSFNPRSRKGNDFERIRKQKRKRVSIHVPARGTTTVPEDAPDLCRVSIHVPARGTTVSLPKYFINKLGFNPRSRKGNDTANGHRRVLLVVSIHVPARGTTAIIYKFPLYFLLLSMQLYQYNPGNASPADHTHLTLSQYYGANLPDTLCPLLFRTNPVLHCCFI